MIAEAQKRIPIADAAMALGVTERTLRRWYRDGLRDGRVRLDVLRIGGRRYVTEDGLDEFRRSLDRQADRPVPVPARADTERAADARMEARRKRRRAVG